MNTPLEVRCSRDVYDPYNEDVRFYLRMFDRASDRIGIVQPLTIETRPMSEVQGTVVEPTFRLESEQAQKVMDELWSCGFRPREGTGSAGSLAATERHLADMQKLVFKDFP